MKKLVLFFIFFSWMVVEANYFDDYLKRHNSKYPWQIDTSYLNSDSVWAEFYLQKVDAYYASNPDSAVFYIKKSEAEITEKQLDYLKPKLYFRHANYLYTQEKLDDAISLYEKAFISAESHKDTLIASLSLTNLALLNSYQSNDYEFLKYAKEAIKYNEFLKIHVANMRIWLMLGHYYLKHHDTIQAVECSYTGVESAVASGFFKWIPWAKTQYAMCLSSLNKLKSADSIMTELMPIADTISDHHVAQEMYLAKAKTSNFLANGDEALKYIDKAENIYPISSTFDSLDFNVTYADAYANLGQYDKAIALYKIVLSKQSDKFDLYLRIETIDRLIRALTATNRYKELAKIWPERKKLYEKYTHLLDLDLRTKHEVELKLQDNEIKTKTAQLEVQESDQRSQLLAFIVIIISFSAVMLVVRSRIAKKQLQLKLENTNLQKTIEINKHLSEIKQKENELLKHTKIIAEKQEIISKLQVEIDKNKSQNIPTFSLEQVMEEIQKETMSLESFDLRFNELYPDFYQILSCQYNALTQAEIRVCALVKLNMSSKEIANLLCVSPSTVDNHRFKIRKKMNLEKGCNLFDAIQNL